MILKIIISVILGSLIGLERERHGKVVGVRTLSLICLGATLFTLMSPFGYGDESRVVAQIVSGVGFLGAGIIFKNGDNIYGLTTAATILVSAAIGCLIGMGMFLEASVGCLVIVVINMFFKHFKCETNKKFNSENM